MHPGLDLFMELCYNRTFPVIEWFMFEISQKQGKKEVISAIFIIVFAAIFVVSNLFLGFSLPVYLATMLMAAGIAFFYPLSGVWAVIFLTVVFERFFTLQSIFWGRNEWKLYPIDLILGAVILGTIFQMLNGKIKWQFKKPDWLVIGFAVLAIAYFFLSVGVLGGDMAVSFSSAKNYAFYPLVYFLVWLLANSQEKIKKTLQFVMAGAVAIIAFISYGIINGGGLWTEFTPLSTEGVRILAFSHAFYLGLALIGSLAAYLGGEWKNKTWFLILSAIWAVGVIGSLMRHLWIALAVALVFLLALATREQRQKTGKLIAAYVVVIIGIAMTIFYFSLMLPRSAIHEAVSGVTSAVEQRASSLTGNSEDESFLWRATVWKEALREYSKSPVLGIGFGQAVFIEIGRYWDLVEVRNVHNSPLVIFVQMGLAGLGLFGWLGWTFAQMAWKQARRDWVSFALLGALIYYGVAFLFQPYLEANLLGIFFWIILGLIRAQGKLSEQAKPYENTRNQ
ncbi:hypothetical protein EPO05_04845 [Patescibacteria group bacterium]|nr:MAG: hypothetical protein EPO05_04845 [Patescibacteria group bacterium]